MKKRLNPNDRNRHYCNIKLLPNQATHSAAPDFITHSICSFHLNDYIRECVRKNKPVTFDIACFATRNIDNDLVITISVPFFDNAKPKFALDEFTE
jgi:hypothetical protein